MTAEYDKRRMELSILISFIIWAFLFLCMAFIRIKGPPIPRDSMNPLYIELAPPEIIPEPPPQQQRVGGSSNAASNALVNTGRSVPQQGASGQGTSGPVQGGQSTPAPSLRPDPESSSLPSQPRNPSAYQGGTDPFAPLNENSLRSDTPPAPVNTSAPAARASSPEGRQTAAPQGLPRTDGFSNSLGEAEQKLSGPGGGAQGTGTGSSGGFGTSGSGQAGTGVVSGGGDLAGNFDFGEGIVRELWSSRKTRVPDRFLAGQPDTISTRVSFTIEPGGSVLLNTIRFEPPLPQELDAFLRAFFGSWLFSPADSDGQVRFQYSIKVR